MNLPAIPVWMLPVIAIGLALLLAWRFGAVHFGRRSPAVDDEDAADPLGDEVRKVIEKDRADRRARKAAFRSKIKELDAEHRKL